MTKEEIKTIIDSFKESDSQIFAQITYSREWRPGDEATIIGLFHGEDEFGNLIWGHPYDINKQFMTAGAVACFLTDITDIQPVTVDDYKLWYKEYQQFHKSVLKEKLESDGKAYDFCVENLKNVKIFTEKDEQ